MLTSLSVDEILLPRYVNRSKNFRGLLLKVEMAYFCFLLKCLLFISFLTLRFAFVVHLIAFVIRCVSPFSFMRAQLWYRDCIISFTRQFYCQWCYSYSETCQFQFSYGFLLLIRSIFISNLIDYFQMYFHMYVESFLSQYILHIAKCMEVSHLKMFTRACRVSLWCNG